MTDAPIRAPGGADAPALIRRWEQLAAERSAFEATWQDIADNLLGRRDFLAQAAPGRRRDARIYDGTAMLAADVLAASLHGMLTNPSTRWFTLRLGAGDAGREDADGDAARLWLEAVEERLYAAFESPEGGHAQACHEFYLDLAAFGTAGLHVADAAGRAVQFGARALGELYVAEDAAGRVDTVVRKFSHTARQAHAEWGKDAGPAVLKALDGAREEDRFDFLHWVGPRAARDPRREMAYDSATVSLADRAVVRTGGYRELPYMVARWSKDAGETYGRGPGWNALADAKMLHAMSRTVIRAAQKVVDPPLLVADDGVVMPVRTVPGGLNFGRMDGRGDFIKPLATGARLDIGLEMMEQRRAAIRAAFHADVLQVMRDPRMTAAQVYEIAAELMRVMGPVLGRLQSEFLGPMIGRTFAILSRRGALPSAPPALARLPIKVEYVSPLARAQKAGQAGAVMRTYEPALQLAATDPTVLDNLDADEAVRVLAEANGLPAKVLRSRAAVERRREASAPIPGAAAGATVPA